jgi:hypothetical protein
MNVAMAQSSDISSTTRFSSQWHNLVIEPQQGLPIDAVVPVGPLVAHIDFISPLKESG